MLTLADARYLRVDRRPILEVAVDGQAARMGTDCKPTAHAAGLVFLGDTFEDVMPPIRFTPAGGGMTTLRGYTRDARVHRLYDAFLAAARGGNYRPGPVAIPE